MIFRHNVKKAVIVLAVLVVIYMIIVNTIMIWHVSDYDKKITDLKKNVNGFGKECQENNKAIEEIKKRIK